MTDHLTPHQVAQAIGVSESSLKRWCDRGLLQTQRTAGGHRRIALESVIQFLRGKGQVLARPDLLGLPAAVGVGEFVLDRAASQLEQALVEGDEDRCRRLILDLYLNRHSPRVIGDEVIFPAFVGIGERWSCGKMEVYRERHACEIMLRILRELRTLVPPLEREAPRAIGSALEGDPYALATTLIELALRDSGWQAESYGALLPAASLAAAVREQRPRLCWISVSHILDRERFLAQYAILYEAAQETGTAIAVGGQALDESTRGRMSYSAYCENLKRLDDFANSLKVKPG